jgi:hypothetical protein
MEPRLPGRVAGAAAFAVLLMLARDGAFQAQTNPVTGVAGFETGLHDLAFLTMRKSKEVGISWGDGAATRGLVRCFEPVANPNDCHVYGTHAYRNPGTYTIEINYVEPAFLGGIRKSVFTTATISPASDFVILSIGDSVASGEGLPAVLYGGGPGSEPNQGFWQDPASNYSPAELPIPLIAEDNELRVPTCHRSPEAGPALAARRVGATNRVTFVHLACSGAVIVPTFRPTETSEETRRGFMDRQLRLARQRLGRIDVLLISGGANNMTFRPKLFPEQMRVGFGEVIKRCVVNADGCHNDPLFRRDIQDSIEGNPGRIEFDKDGVEYRFPGLQRLYGDLDQLIRCLNPDGSRDPACTDEQIPKLVLITEYFDPTHDETGQFKRCFGISTEEWAYLHDEIVVRLNNHVRNSPWHAVSGLEDEFFLHGFCAPDATRWVIKRPESLDNQNDDHGTAHPTRTGQDVYHRHIYDALIRLNPPVTSANAATAGMPYEFGTTAGGEVAVTLFARNPIKESAVGSTLYSVNGPECGSTGRVGCATYEGPIILSASGTYTIRFFSENAAGAFEKARSVVVKIDRATAGGCTTVQPAPTWVCVNGGWVPPDHPLASPSPPVACSTPRPGPDWVCVNGGWVPPDHPLARGGGID